MENFLLLLTYFIINWRFLFINIYCDRYVSWTFLIVFLTLIMAGSAASIPRTWIIWYIWENNTKLSESGHSFWSIILWEPYRDVSVQEHNNQPSSYILNAWFWDSKYVFSFTSHGNKPVRGRYKLPYITISIYLKNGRFLFFLIFYVHPHTTTFNITVVHHLLMFISLS